MDTIPNEVYTGTVTSVSNVINAESNYTNSDLKVYDTVITLDNSANTNLLRSGMSCTSEIIIDQYEKAVYVPLQAVLSVGGKPTVYMVKGNKIKPRTVEIGLDNSTIIRIASGLKPGEIVSLYPPLAQAAVVEALFEVSDVSSAPAPGTSSAFKSDNQSTGSGALSTSDGNNQRSGPATRGNAPATQ